MARHSRKYKIWHIVPMAIIFAVCIILGAFWGYRFINPDLGVEGTTTRDDTITSTAPPTVVPEGTKEKQILYVCGEDRVKMYEEPYGRVIDRLAPNTSVIYLDMEDEFTRVEYNGKEGYIKTENLSKIPEEPTPKPNQKGDKTRRVIGSCRVEHESGTDIFLRALPSEEGTVIDYIPDKTVLEVTENNGDWTGVIYNGQHGYVKTRYIVPLESTL